MATTCRKCGGLTYKPKATKQKTCRRCGPTQGPR